MATGGLGVAVLVGAGLLAMSIKNRPKTIAGVPPAASLAPASITGPKAPAPPSPSDDVAMCGRFKGMQVPAPPGFKILSCQDAASYSSLTYTGDGDFDRACTTIQAWPRGVGWTRTTENPTSVAFQQGSNVLMISCTKIAAQPVITLSLSTGAGPAAVAPGSSATCGRFAEMGIPEVLGFPVVACVDNAGSGSLVMRGDGDLSKGCQTLGAWVSSSAGWTTKLRLKTSTQFQRDSTMLTISCTRDAGQPTIALSLWPAPSEPDRPRHRTHTGPR
jgi:hypothetical protein